ncbi:MAG: DNA recombination protein RmuC [Bacteroidales bacterium]|nr:DNA recombination protein RmuC [Bacteroidales bacterium]
MEIVYIVIGLIFGIIITWLLVKNKFQKEVSKLTLDKNLAEDKINGINENLSNLKDELVNKENTIIDLSKQLASKSADYKNLNDKLQEQKADVEKLQERFKIEFKNLANEILEEKTQKFTELNKINISEILKPLNEKIKDFEKKVEETYDKESKQRFSLKEEVKRLAELNLQVSKDTINLTKALKGDSKVSLTAYERYASADSPEEKEVAAKEHILSIKNHINELSQKNYQDLYQLKSLDFVMMFLPVEPAYLIAIQKDSDLWNYAYDKRVLLISPTNLIAALKMVESLWKQEYQSKNVLEIAKQSGDLYDKFVGLAEDLTDIGNKLKATQKSYDSSMNKLLTGKGNLVGRVEKIKKLGAKTSKVLSQQFLNKLEDEN